MTGLVRRAVGHAGPDRDVFLLIVKSVVAATVAWVIAHNLLGAPSATFAPFTALLMVQATISQSLDQSARYAGAMVVGVVLAGLLTPLLGAATATFAVLMLVSLILGRWRKLGQQGPQVGVAALFAYSSFIQSGAPSASFVQLASIAGLVLLGCSLGVVTNLVIAPPMRYRSAQYSISALSRSLCDLLTDVAEGIRGGVPEQDQADAWLHRANQFPGMVAQARSAVEQAVETRRFNPRRLFLRSSASFEGYRTIINALDRVTEQLRMATRGLTSAGSADTSQRHEHEHFLADYAAVLTAVAEAARVAGQVHRDDDTEQVQQLGDATDQARRAYHALVEQSGGRQLDNPDQWPVYSALQTDVHRLVEEFVQARQNLTQLIETDSASRSW
ncbi:hypothetical protein FHX42_002280 [Saccharopolyspora lacisalsi]|uniref:FUSC family protein n=1 Tax=Halosaccharopolyspora lacisalsi TaxID=1000566 RepID=A0A839DV62_9PSEU|nr:hypothetical protein [Halosaccharopolyspora lacisalsi]